MAQIRNLVALLAQAEVEGAVFQMLLDQMVGLVAGFEVPFMLALPRLQKLVRRQSLLLAGALIYAGFVVLLALFPDGLWLWALPVLAGLGAAPILTLPIGYWQDLMAGRPGTAGTRSPNIVVTHYRISVQYSLMFESGARSTRAGISSSCLWTAVGDRYSCLPNGWEPLGVTADNGGGVDSCVPASV